MAILYGDIKKLVTQLADQIEPKAQCGFVCLGLAELNSSNGAKNTTGIMNDSIILLAKANPNEGTKTAQAPNQENLLAEVDKNSATNQDNKGIRDAIASFEEISTKRTRKQHIIGPLDEKAVSAKTSTRKGEILEVTLYKVILSELNKYQEKDGKFNGIIRIINSNMLQNCYSLIKSNPGNMTPGTKPITLDGISIAWFDKTETDIKEGRFKFSPARQVLIPKPRKPGEFRQLLIANPREKIVQKALQVILTAIFDPHFSKTSFGFRPGLSYVNALDLIHMRGGHMAWAINGDIKKCFDQIQIPHEIIMNCVKEKITCARTLALIERGLTAGYKNEKGELIKTKIGTPQGSILSPLLSKIVLDKFYKYIESLDSELNVGTSRRRNKEYQKLESSRAYYKTKSKSKNPNPEKARELLKEMRKLTKYDMHDPKYPRSMFVRFADDFVILLASTRDFAISIKEKVTVFLKEHCGLELNQNKTTIINTREGFDFLGAFIKRRTNSSIFNSFTGKDGNKITRRTTLRMAVDAPIKKLIEKLIENGFARRNHLSKVLAKGKTAMVFLTHFDIIRFFNSKITGLLTAYRFAGNFSLMARVIWILRQSCALTLARKFKLKTMRKTFKKFGMELRDPLTGVFLNIPATFSANHDFKTKPHPIFGLAKPTEALDNLLNNS
jgi:group II intron reverse transcriptase/maturase